MNKPIEPTIPPFQEYFEPILKALSILGGSATNRELEEQVAELMELSDEQMSILHAPERGNQTEVGYRMAWARTYLKKVGYLENSKRGVWSLTSKGRNAEIDDPMGIVYTVREMYDGDDTSDAQVEERLTEETSDAGSTDWQEELFDILYEMPADAFERLCQRLLRECGFVEVEVTGRSGDGGIDGSGIMRLQRLVSVHVLFQCKRYRPDNPVGARDIRDFRGAMQGRTDKGLFITTGRFTSGADREATRDGAPTIDLIDGDQLIDLLKELELGIQTEVVQKVTVKREWFQTL